MPAIDRIGLFKGLIKDHGVTKTRKKELPQFIVTLLATHMYNEATEEWNKWDYEQTADGYFVLVTLDKHGNVVKCLNYNQVMEATGWDGVTFSSLATMDLKNHPVQFRVQEDIYEGNTSLKVNWIAGVDAEVGLRKLTGKDLTDLDAKFGIPSDKPAATPAKPKTGKKTPRPKLGKPEPKPAEAEIKAALTPPKPPVKKATPKPPEKEESAAETCTEEEAYATIHAANAALDKPAPDEVRDDWWWSGVQEVAADEDNVTDTEWPMIRDKTLEKINIPF